jgi:FkbM family methyltransferase
MIAHQVGKHAEAAALIVRAVAVNPASEVYHNNLGLVYRALEKRAEAEACYQRALQRKPDFPEALNNLANVLRDQGRTADAIDHYRRALELKPDYAEAHNNLGAVLREVGQVAEAIACYERALKLKPDYAEAYSNLGAAFREVGQMAEAIACYERALELKPDYAEARSNLGTVLQNQGRPEEALAACQRAVQLKPNDPASYTHLGSVLRQQRRYDEALACYDQALQLKPNDSQALKGRGATLCWKGRLTEGVDAFRQALQEIPEDAETHTNVGLSLLLLGRFAEGWPEYEWRWKAKGRSLPEGAPPLWDGSSLDGKSILLVAEQGIGDTLFLVRYAAVLKERFACRVLATVPGRLVPLLRTCPGIDLLVAQEEPLPTADVFIPLASIPARLGDTLESFPRTIPYLSADPDLVERWKQQLQAYAGLKIGIVWQGSPQFQADQARSVPLAEMAALGRLKGIHLFSLQKGYGAEQLDSLAGALEVVDLGAGLDNTTPAFVETAAVLKNLDLLIAPDTAIAHLAGALGVEVWTALSQPPDWRWLLDREDTPWYPTMRLFRQPRSDDWRSVFERMADTLAQRPGVELKQPADYRVATCGINRLARTRHGLMLFNRFDRYIGHSLDVYGEFSEGEVILFRQLLGRGQTAVDVGANVGAHSLVFSELVGTRGTVYAFEPQRILFQLLCANMALNGRVNVHCRPEALGEAAGSSCVPPLNYAVEENFGAAALRDGGDGERVPVLTLDSLDLPRCNLLKIDVEGMELRVLQGARQTIERCRPLLYVENDRAEKSAALIAYLMELGYDLYWHHPPLFNASNYYGNAVNEFGTIVSVNMLGIHRSQPSAINGLRRIEGPDSDWRARPA